jgi:hypothetical protein
MSYFAGRREFSHFSAGPLDPQPPPAFLAGRRLTFEDHQVDQASRVRRAGGGALGTPGPTRSYRSYRPIPLRGPGLDPVIDLGLDPLDAAIREFHPARESPGFFEAAAVLVSIVDAASPEIFISKELPCGG